MPNTFYTFKDAKVEIRLFKQRIAVVAVIILISACILISRLFWLQVLQHTLYVTLSEKNQLNLVPLAPNRGLIYDRNGILLAENLPAFSLNIVPDRVPNLNQTLTQLQKILPITEEDLRLFRKQLQQRRRSEPLPIRLRLTDDELALFSLDQYRFPGVVIKAELVRHYPLAEELVSVLGYVSRISEKDLEKIDLANYNGTNYIGKIGIEKYYESLLHGTVGYEEVETDASGRVVRTLKQILPVPGQNLYLTIDSKLQTAAVAALNKMRGAIVAIDPNNGDILALVSHPSYDPNLFVRGIKAGEFKALREAPDQPLYNRALRGQYPPGSTVKPFMALAGLENNVVTPNYGISDPGWYQLPNSSHRYRDWKHTGHGWVNLTSAIMQSCDTYFYNLANKLGIKRMSAMLNQFGFGQLTGIASYEELPGLLPTPEWKKRARGKPWYPGDTLITGIGQGFMLATPLQLAQAAAMLANQGEGFQPRLLLKAQKPKAQPSTILPKPLPPITAKDSSWELVLNAMHEVIHSPSGTGYKFSHGLQYEMAGKTGTAQVFSLKQNQKYNASILPERLRDHSLFIGFAPFEQPRIAIAVLIENSSVPAGTVARQVLDAYLIGKKIEPSNPEPAPTPSPAEETD